MVDEPEHIAEGVAVKEVGATDIVLSVTVTETHEVTLQSPSART